MRALPCIAALGLAVAPPIEVQRPADTAADSPASSDSEPASADATETGAHWGPSSSSEPSDAATRPSPDDEPEALAPASTTVPPRVDPANRRLVVAGNIVTAFGGAGFITMVVGLVLRDNSIDRLDTLGRREELDAQQVELYRGRRDLGTGLSIGGGAAAGALFAAGITMIVVGNKRERKRREALDQQSLSPTFGPDHVGLRWRIAF